MPQLANLVLEDRSATPNHTFVPRDIIAGVATVEESTGIPIGNNRISVSLVRTQGGRYKATLKGSFPIVQTQTVNGISNPVVVRTGYFDCTFAFAENSTEEERHNVVGLLYSALDPGIWVNDVLTKLQGVY